MKKYLFYILFFLSMLFYAACFDDKSSLAGDPIPEIIIDTTGIPAQHNIVQFDRLQINPKVSQAGVENPSNLSYKWMLNTIATAAQGESASLSNYICIGRQEVLDTVIELKPNNTTYFLWYQVTDNEYGIRKDILWNVKVLNAYNEGLLIAETRDERTTDFSLIEGKQFTEGWTKDTKITHELYSKTNEISYNGLIKQICHAYNSSTKSKRFYCIGDDFYCLIDGLSYELVGENHEVIYDKTLEIAPSQIFYTKNGMVMVNEGKIYPFIPNTERDYPSICIPMGIQVQEGDHLVQKTAQVDKYIAYIHSSSEAMETWGCWYDKGLGMFECQKFYGPAVTTGITKFEYDPASHPFDPNKVPGLETRYAAVGMNGDFYMIMKNIETGNYQIYVLSVKKNCPENLYEISNNEMDGAISYVVSEDGNVVYFATTKDIYAIVLGGVSPEVKKIYTIPSGGITHFSMFRQAKYLLKGTTSSQKLMDEHEHLLLTGVWDGSSGSLLTIPIKNPADATIDNNNIKTYSGFGKILTVVSQQQ